MPRASNAKPAAFFLFCWNSDHAAGQGGSLRLAWRGRAYYASGAPEKEIGAGAALGAIQTALNESGFSFLREE